MSNTIITNRRSFLGTSGTLSAMAVAMLAGKESLAQGMDCAHAFRGLGFADGQQLHRAGLSRILPFKSGDTLPDAGERSLQIVSVVGERSH